MKIDINSVQKQTIVLALFKMAVSSPARRDHLFSIAVHLKSGATFLEYEKRAARRLKPDPKVTYFHPS